MLTVVLLVALRLCLGCHFLYEGTWKIANADKFSAEPFLTQAKGPMAGMFYAMVYDIDGRARLRVELGKDGKPALDKNRLPIVRSPITMDQFDTMHKKLLGSYGLDDKQKDEAAGIRDLYKKGLQTYLNENSEDIAAYFLALDSLERRKAAGNQGVEFQKKRLWDDQMKLRWEVRVWLDYIEGVEAKYSDALRAVLNDEQRPVGPLPKRLARGDFVDFAVTYGLTAIGLCLILGLFTRPAAIGGGVFMFFVVLTQPAWPTIYPHAPPVAGHAPLINKDFIEMVVLFMLASTCAGRWGGLDFFVENYFVHACKSLRKQEKQDRAEGTKP